MILFHEVAPELPLQFKRRIEVRVDHIIFDMCEAHDMDILEFTYDGGMFKMLKNSKRERIRH